MDIEIAREFQHAARRLARAPSFTLISLATLSLAIGATTAVFSLVNGVILKPLDFARPDRRVYLHDFSPNEENRAISPQELLDYRAQTHSFTDVDPELSLTLVRPSAPAVRLSAARVGATFFSVLGVNDAVRTVIGVAPRFLTYPDNPELWYPAHD
jgi:putative ABC transport system permease protein